jgi:hypothetical protein
MIAANANKLIFTQGYASTRFAVVSLKMPGEVSDFVAKAGDVLIDDCYRKSGDLQPQ